MRDRAVGIASCEGALKGDGNEREMMARVAKSTSGSSSHTQATHLDKSQKRSSVQGNATV